MKKYYIIAACALVLMWGCTAKNAKSKSDETKVEHDHSHDGHDHEHDPDHAHDGHNHDDEDPAHDHGDEANNHDGHNHGTGDEIIITPEQAKIIGLQTEKIHPSVFNQVIKTSGQIVAAQGEERTIVATVGGVVSFTKADANEGKPVKNGESLFNISSSHLAEGDPVMKAKSTYDIAKREYDRAELLVADKLISQKEYSEIKLTYENARIAYNAISGGGRSKGANISSPINGFIKSKLVVEGQYVNVGDPLMVVTQNNKLQLRAEVSERYYRDLQNIRSANFKTPYDKSIYRLADMGGQLLSYGKSTNDAEYYIPVNFQFNNIGSVMPGAYVEVYLLSGEMQNVLSIPLSCLTDEQGLYFIYCKLGAEEYEKCEVKLGATDGERIEILSGLKSGDEVVTKGAYHVKLASASEAIPHGHEH